MHTLLQLWHIGPVALACFLVLPLQKLLNHPFHENQKSAQATPNLNGVAVLEESLADSSLALPI